MARFSRLRRSARLLLLASGICGLTASPAWSRTFIQDSNACPAVSASQSAAVDAYISGFKAMVGTSKTQKFDSLPQIKNGSTIAQVLLKHNAKAGKNALGGRACIAAVNACDALTIACHNSAKEESLDVLSRKFLAIEQIETAALAHCREFAFNSELCGMALETVHYPVYRSHTLRSVKAAAVACFEALSVNIDDDTPRDMIPCRICFDINITADSPNCFLEYQPASKGSEGYFFVARWPGPLEILRDAAVRLLAPDELQGSICTTTTVLDPQVAQGETILGKSVPEMLTLIDAETAQDMINRPLTCNERAMAAAMISADIQAMIVGSPARIGIDFDFTIAAETNDIPSVVTVTPRLIEHDERDLNRLTPRLIIIEEEEERLLGTATTMGDHLVAAAQAVAAAPHGELIAAGLTLEIQVSPLIEPGLLAMNDAAPLENPVAEYVQQLPSGDDAPMENPELVASAARIVSPTMSPDEYVAAFQDKIAAQQESSNMVIPVAHEELLKQCDSPILRALGGPISVTPCESETCKGFLIQFGPTAKTEPVAEAQAFDGPAQVMLHDGKNAAGNGFVWPAQPVAHQETIDELADRLEREFLARAVSGQLPAPVACPAVDKEAAAQAAAACPADVCLPETCPPGPYAPRGCPGIAVETCSPPSGIPSPHSPSVASRSQWSLPTPVITVNPYAQGAPICGPGAGVTLPRDFEFYTQSHGAPDGPLVASTYPPAAPPTFATTPRLALAPSCGSAPPAYPVPSVCPAPAVCAAPASAVKTPVSPETLETIRDISRTLGQLAERCEAQGLFDRADELRELAQEYRMSARIIHGHLSALPMPMPGYVQLPMQYAVPSTYSPEPMPMMVPPPVAPAMYPQPQPQPLPIAQPMLTAPRY